MKKWLSFVLLFIGPLCYAQSATVDWSTVHQQIDGFGAADVGEGAMTSAQQAFFFGTGSGGLGLSILWAPVPDGTDSSADIVGDCSSVGTPCVGNAAYAYYVSDMQAMVANGGRIYLIPFSPPAQYKTNNNAACSAGSGSGTLISGDYGLYATWLANAIESLSSVYSIPVYGITGGSNEPEYCESYASSIWSAAQIDSFIKNNLGPTFAADSISTLIFMPEVGDYYALTTYGATCATDSSCMNYVGGVSYHDYDISSVNLSVPSVSQTPYPSGWPAKKYWQNSSSCGNAGSNSFCGGTTFNPTMSMALNWAAVFDDRMAVENESAWIWWWMLVNSNDGQGLECTANCGSYSNGTVQKTAYVLGQYARFIRPGYYRISATHIPQAGISVSAYQDLPSGHLVIVATNYTSSAVAQTFSLTNAPTFTSVTPYTTSANEDIQAQTAQSLSGNVFSYMLPADSVTTFVGSTSSTSAGPAAPTNLRASIN